MTVDVVGHTQQNLIYEFNYLPARYLHDNWWMALPNGNILKLLRGNQRIENRLSEIIMNYFGIQGEYSFNFNDGLEVIGLQSNYQINELLNYLGLIYAGHQINQIIIKAKLLEYEELIGKEKYKFVRDIAPIMREDIGISGSMFPVRLDQFLIYIKKIGMNILSKAMSEKNSLFKNRLMLKLGQESKHYFMGEKVCYQVNISYESSQLILSTVVEYLSNK